MTNKKAKQLWEHILIHGAKSDSIKELGLDMKEIKVFMSYTMPEIFVDDEISRVNLSRVKELKKEEKQILSVLKTKKSSNLIMNIGLSAYFILVFPILVLITYLKYFA